MRASHRTLAALCITSGLTFSLASPVLAEEAEPSDSAISDIIHSYLQSRAGLITGETDSEQGSRFTSKLTHELGAQEGKLRAHRDQLRKLPFGGHRDAEVQVRVGKVDRSGSGVIRARAAETTKLFFRSVSTTVDPATGLTPPQHEGYSLTHDFVLRTEDGRWKIDSTTPHLDGSALPPPTQADKTMKAPQNDTVTAKSDKPAPRVERPNSAPTPDSGATPNRQGFTPRAEEAKTVAAPLDWLAMLAYADRWWGQVPDSQEFYNPEFRKYGNDCTNFFSQIILRGGLEPVGYWWNRTDPDVWFYGPSGEGFTAYSWAAAHNNAVYMYNFSGHTRDLVAGDPYGVWKAQPADVMYVNWDHPPNDPNGEGNLDHTMFVSGREAYPEDPTWPYAKEIFLTYHTNNRHNVPLTSVMFRDGWSNKDGWSALHTF